MRRDHVELGLGKALDERPTLHAQGPPPLELLQLHARGTNPACAGTTLTDWLWPPETSDQPRMRRDHAGLGRDAEQVVGPPPHARGPPHPARVPGTGQGTTPACAGTTEGSCGHFRRERDHPRMRGDHQTFVLEVLGGEGPPPHARGPHGRHRAGGGWHGTTPACAGTTWAAPCRRGVARDHPRMCGDHVTQSMARSPTEGPPPHVRGPLPALNLSALPCRTTPACAGTTIREVAT